MSFKLVGQYDSPYTRRVAISLTVLGFSFSQIPLSLFADFEDMKAINPLVRIPSLILPDGEVLIDSGAILDYLDEQVGPDKALIPPSGKERRMALKIIAIATGAIDKAMAINYERNQRPANKQYAPWTERLTTQLQGALSALEALPQTPWLSGDRLSQTDITTAAMIGYIKLYTPHLFDRKLYPQLNIHALNCEALPAFKSCLPHPDNIGGNLKSARQAIDRLAC